MTMRKTNYLLSFEPPDWSVANYLLDNTDLTIPPRFCFSTLGLLQMPPPLRLASSPEGLSRRTSWRCGLSHENWLMRQLHTKMHRKHFPWTSLHPSTWSSMRGVKKGTRTVTHTHTLLIVISERQHHIPVLLVLFYRFARRTRLPHLSFLPPFNLLASCNSKQEKNEPDTLSLRSPPP